MRRFLLAALALIAMTAPARAQQGVVTLAGDEWCPYICKDAAKPGILVDIARLAFAKAGLKIDVKLMPWARAYKDARAGKDAGVIGVQQTLAGDLVFPEVAQAQSVVTFYVRKNSPWYFNATSDLPRVSLGTIVDYSYNPFLDDYILRNAHDMKRIQAVAGDQALASNVKKLIAGRIDATVETAAVMEHYLNSVDLRKAIVPAGRMPETQDLFIAFSPKDPKAKEYADLVAAETQQLILSGEMNALWARYTKAEMP